MPLKSSSIQKRILSIDEENEARRRLLSASPERVKVVDKIAMAQERMKARQSGVMTLTKPLVTGMNYSDDDAPNSDGSGEVDENFIPENFRKKTMMAIPDSVKKDPTKYYKFMS